MFIAYAAITGLLGGLAAGLFGVGGGLVFVPLMILFMGIHPHLAIGTSLAIVIPTAMVGMLKYWKAGMVDWKLVAAIAVFSVVGSWIGASLSLKLSPALIKKIYALFLAVLALKLFLAK